MDGRTGKEKTERIGDDICQKKEGFNGTTVRNKKTAGNGGRKRAAEPEEGSSYSFARKRKGDGPA